MPRRLANWARDWRHIWDGLGRLQAEAAAHAAAEPVLYGRLGEMGHYADRADTSWGPAGIGTEPEVDR